MAYDIFGVREMTEVITQMKPVGGFFRDRFFAGPIEEHNAMVVDFDIYKGTRMVAPYTKITSKSTPLARTPFSTGGFTIPYIKLNRSLAAADVIFKRGQGESIYSTKTPAQRAAEQIARDLFEIETAIQRAEELQAAQAIVNAKVIIKGDVVDAEIDLQRDAALTFTAPVLWSAAANVHEQLRAWAALVFAKSGYNPNTMVASSLALNSFFGNASVKEWFNHRNASVGNINAGGPSVFPGAKHYGDFAGFDIWEYNDLWLDDADNTEKPFIPVDSIVLASTGMRCTAHYGPIVDFGSLQPMKRFAKSIEEQDPSQKVAIVQTAPAFINHTPDATALIKVV